MRVTVSVIDAGEEIPHERTAGLFDPFQFTEATLKAIEGHERACNLRELQHFVERSLVLGKEPPLPSFPATQRAPTGESVPLPLQTPGTGAGSGGARAGPPTLSVTGGPVLLVRIQAATAGKA
ncbi:MAG: hypothetical protein HYZ53_01845 [Planctomycetes bacterium]|nr:hypothetical protein [Planctomycetota bacterium]